MRLAVDGPLAGGDKGPTDRFFRNQLAEEGSLRFVDATAGNYPTVIVSAGKRGLQLELTPEVLLEASEASLAPISSSS